MCVRAFGIVPSILVSNAHKDIPWKPDFLLAAMFFSADMPQLTAINAELDIWETYWTDVFSGVLPTTIGETLKVIDKGIYPNIYACLRILGTLPPTSCECERSISKMGLVLTDLRSRMGQKRFNALVLMSTHKDLTITPDEVIDVFKTQKDRRIDL